uniref:Uncharacterized protein n=1 Tax=Setaria italica TaxID=4555 RepID=K3YFL0_SETIT
MMLNSCSSSSWSKISLIAGTDSDMSKSSSAESTMIVSIFRRAHGQQCTLESKCQD